MSNAAHVTSMLWCVNSDPSPVLEGEGGGRREGTEEEGDGVRP